MCLSKGLTWIMSCLGVILLLQGAFAEPVTPVQAEPEGPASEYESKTPPLNDFAALSNYRTERGFSNLEPFSVALLDKGAEALREGERKEAVAFFRNAIAISPDLPESYIYMARAHFSLSPEGLSESMGDLIDTWEALTRNVWWSFKTVGALMSILYYAFFLSVLICFTILIASNYRLFLHDVMEDSKKILLLAPSVVLVFLAPVLGLFAMLAPFWAYLRGREKGLVYCLVLGAAAVMLSSHYHSALLNASSDVTIRNIVNVNTGMYTGDRTYVLDTKSDYESRFTHALDQKRKGNFTEAIMIYTSLLGRRDDAIIYNNIANCYIGLADYEMARQYYRKALQSSRSASAYYNLSQLSREIFDFKNAKAYYGKALEVSADEVAAFASVRGQTARSSVVDETLGIRDFWHMIFLRARRGLSSGLLGNIYSFIHVWVSVPLMLILAALVTLYGRRISSSAYRCEKCGRIYCGHCEKKPEKNDVCLTCFRFLSQKTVMTPRERMARTIDMYRYRDYRNKAYRILSYIIPGSGHIYVGNAFTGFVIQLLVLSFALSLIFWSFSVPPDSMTAYASLFQWLSACLLLTTYAFSFLTASRKVS
jgi:tetratricopeptide (TPR) repeat protein